MRGIAIVFLAIVACASAHPVEEQQISVQLPESPQEIVEKDAVVPEASEIVQIVAVPESNGEQSQIQQLLEVDAGVPASIEATRAARQFYGGYGGYPGYGGYGRYPGYGGYGRYPGYGGYGRYPGYGGYGRYPGYGGFGGFGGFGAFLG